MRIISGKYGRRRFDVPTNITARPTTDMARENLFNVLGNIIDLEGKTALDLFAGTGAMSFEFLSRGCAHVTSVEKARTQAEFIKKVQNQLGDPNLTLVRGDVFKFIATCRQSFDIIFADPPYDLPRFGDIPELVSMTSARCPISRSNAYMARSTFPCLKSAIPIQNHENPFILEIDSHCGTDGCWGAHGIPDIHARR